MLLSIVVPITPDFPYHRDGHDDTSIFPDDISNTSTTPSEDSESWYSSHSFRSNSLRMPASIASKTCQPGPSRTSSTSSSPIFNCRPSLTPPVVRWCTPPESPSTSSSTLVESLQGDNESAGGAVDTKLHAHLQTCLDENRANRLANRSVTIDGAVSH